MSIKNRIINDEFSDYHIHSIFSDGTATIEEITQYAGVIWMKNITITDHSDASMEFLLQNRWVKPWAWARYSMKRRENVWNDVNVLIWVEADVLNENWYVCFNIQGTDDKSDFSILALHRTAYQSPAETSWTWFLKAIEKYHDKIDCIWHPYDKFQHWKFIEIKSLVDLCNQYDIPIEFNFSVLVRERAIEDKLIYMLKNTKKIYINSDAHTLADLKQKRKACYDFIDSLE